MRRKQRERKRSSHQIGFSFDPDVVESEGIPSRPEPADEGPEAPRRTAGMDEQEQSGLPLPRCMEAKRSLLLFPDTGAKMSEHSRVRIAAAAALSEPAATDLGNQL